jgi:3-hydroxyisobutyrate dehydrogenase
MRMPPRAAPVIGFIGIGNMGWPMAARLADAGFAVIAYDVRPDRVRDFVAATGAQAAPSLESVGRAADFIVTMLPDSDVVAAALRGDGDCLELGMRSGAVVIEMSSGVPDKTRALAERLAAGGVALIDAPVSGGVARARIGELTIMVGGEAETIERCLPVLKPMGATILRTGPLGSGQAMKALNNLVSAGGFLIGIEALLIGRKLGLDSGVMVDVLNASTGMNNSTQRKFKQFVLSRSFDSGFALSLMVKDLSIALEIARAHHANVPFAALCRELWAAAGATLEADADHTALARLCESLAGAVLGAPPSPGAQTRRPDGEGDRSPG